MARSKSSAGYPPSFRTILESVVKYEGQPFTFPAGFRSYTAPGLRTTYQCYLKALQDEAKRDPANPDKQELAIKAVRAIVRIRNGLVTVEDRHNDSVEQELVALLQERGIKSDWEKSLERLNAQTPVTEVPVVDPVQSPPDEGCTKCGGYGCEACDARMVPQEPDPAPAPAPTQSDRVRDLTKQWLGK